MECAHYCDKVAGLSQLPLFRKQGINHRRKKKKIVFSDQRASCKIKFIANLSINCANSVSVYLEVWTVEVADHQNEP